ncbi:PGM2, partial [Cervus elaphus hippelaphus]
PYTVSHLNLCAGIMITASHNPKQDNGYKSHVCVSSHSPHACFRAVNKETKVKFVHTSVHGVGHSFVQSAFKAFDLIPPEAVPEQKDPDPEFPTVKYPNPEEGEGVLTLSFALADKAKAKIILANDPDADRLAVAEKQESGEWKVFSGNELGALLGWWLFTSWKEKNQDHSALQNLYMLSSTVSSKILRAIALKEGFHFEETLTGFKWMGNRAKQLMDQGKNVLFAFEEAIGMATISPELRILSAMIKKLLNNYLKTLETMMGRVIIQKLVADLRFLTLGTLQLAMMIMNLIKKLKSSQMITFSFANGGVATMRTSGTEPKIKYYLELCAPPGNSDPEQLKKELDELVSAIEEHFFQPQKYNLQPKGE